jgi:hypothetical protein
MKTILIVLFALALFTRAQVPGYQAIDITEAQSSTEIQTLIQFGLQTIIQDAISLGYFNNTDFAVSQINGISESVSDSGDYLFDVVYADPSGVTISANFEANYDVSLNSISIISYSYGVSYPGVDPSDDGEPEAVNWTPVSLSAFNSNQELQNLFQFGFANVVANGINNGSIPNTTFVSAALSAIAQRSVANGVVYRFTCKASDKLTTSLNLTFEVVNQLQSSVYDVTILPTPPTNTTDPETGNGEDDGEESEEGEDNGEESEEGEDNGEGSEDGEETIPIDPTEPGNNNSTNTTEPTNPGNNNSTNTTTPGDDNSTAPADDVDIVSGLVYTRLDIDDALESTLVSTALEYGYDAVTALGINQGKLTNTTYSLVEVDKIARSNLTNGVSYLFQVNLIGDNRKILVDSNYTVYYRYSNKTLKLTAYYYNYTIYRNPLPSDDNTTEPTTPGNNTDNGNTTAPGNTTEPTTPGNNTDNGNTTAPGNNTDNGNTTAPVDLYTQIQQDSLLESLFSFGVDRVLASGIAKGKIPNTDYDVTDVFNFARTNLSKTANFRFETKLANNNGSVVIFTNFTVNYRYSNQSMKLNALSYNVSITKVVQPSNNTNTTVPTNTTTPDNGNNSTNTTVPDNTNTTVPSNTYVQVNASDIAASEEIQSVISYGTSQILEKGLAAGKIPSANYTVSEVVSVSKLTQTGGNSYQCSVNLDGDNDAEVKTTFTAFYNSTNQAVSLSKFSYAVLNIPVA